MRRSKEDALETRNAIVRVALECFSKRGYALTTFNDIAARIHLTKGAVFWHFKSKEDLLAELIRREHESYDPLANQKSILTPADLKETMMGWVTAVTSNRERRQFMLFALSRVEWSDALKDRINKKLQWSHYSYVFDGLTCCVARLRALGEIETPLDDEQVATLLLSVFFGPFRVAWLAKRPIDVASTISAGLDAVLASVVKEK